MQISGCKAEEKDDQGLTLNGGGGGRERENVLTLGHGDGCPAL